MVTILKYSDLEGSTVERTLEAHLHQAVIVFIYYSKQHIGSLRVVVPNLV